MGKEGAGGVGREGVRKGVWARGRKCVSGREREMRVLGARVKGREDG